MNPYKFLSRTYILYQYSLKLFCLIYITILKNTDVKYTFLTNFKKGEGHQVDTYVSLLLFFCFFEHNLQTNVTID